MKYGSLQLQVFILHPFASDMDKIRKEMFLGFDKTCSSCHWYHLFLSRQILVLFWSAISEAFFNVSDKEIWNRTIWSSARKAGCHTLDASGLFVMIGTAVSVGNSQLTGNLSNHHHTVNVWKVGLHVQNLKDLDILQGDIL